MMISLGCLLKLYGLRLGVHLFTSQNHSCERPFGRLW